MYKKGTNIYNLAIFAILTGFINEMEEKNVSRTHLSDHCAVV